MFEEKKDKAAGWFKALRDDICAEFEAIEREAPSGLYPGEPGSAHLSLNLGNAR